MNAIAKRQTMHSKIDVRHKEENENEKETIIANKVRERTEI